MSFGNQNTIAHLNPRRNSRFIDKNFPPRHELNGNWTDNVLASLTLHSYSQQETYTTSGSFAAGSDKYTGFTFAPNGCGYSFPTNYPTVTAIIKVDSKNDIISLVGTALGANSGCVLVGEWLYAIPTGVTKFHKFNWVTEKLETFGTVPSGLYIGGVLAGNGKIYCAPITESNILVIDPATDTWYKIPLPGAVTNSCLGAVLLDDIVYLIPYSMTSLPAINTKDDSVKLVGIGRFSGTAQYSGGFISPKRNIYMIPLNNTQVAKYNPSLDLVSYHGSIGGVGTKYYGGFIAANGYGYGIPGTQSNFLKINTDTDEISFSYNLGASTGAYRGGGIGPNGKAYLAPSNFTTVGIFLSAINEGVHNNLILNRHFNKF